MYFIDLFKRILRKSNISLSIYLILNVLIISGCSALVFYSSNVPVPVGLLIGAALYALSLAVALSPFGEWLLRLQTGCKKICRTDYLSYIIPLFREVHERARELDPSVPADVQLFMNEDKSANAFATGRKTICITEGLLRMPPEQIKAALAHEFGHIAHKDTDLILFVTIGNMIITTVLLLLRLFINFIHWGADLAALLIGGRDGVFALVMNSICHAMMILFVGFCSWVWSGVGTTLVMHSSRSAEYEADEFAFHLGFGDALCALLDRIGGERETGLFARLASSHPDKNSRIAHLQQLGAYTTMPFRN